LFLQDYLSNAGINNVSRIIDFAPSAPLSAFIRRRIADSAPPVSYRTADYSGIGVDDQVDITDLQPYADGQFDFFICSHVLEHVTDDRKALSELRRILQPGGKGILMVPIIPSLNEVDEAPNVSDEGERWRRFGQDDHVRIYSKNGFIERVVQSGFEVQQLGKDFFSEASFSRAGITPQSVLYIVEKI
jgi:SAM-dependent methyltransferase